MNLVVNGNTGSFEGNPTVAQLLEALDIRAARVAVMVNEQIVKRDARAAHALADGDRVEIIQMVGGG